MVQGEGPDAAYRVDPLRPDKHIDPRTRIWRLSEWGAFCGRGFISDSRFGDGLVIRRTNRETTRKWRSVKATRDG